MKTINIEIDSRTLGLLINSIKQFDNYSFEHGEKNMIKVEIIVREK